MKLKFHNLLSFCFLFFVSLNTVKADNPSVIHTWKMVEIVLEAKEEYKYYYTDVTCWVDLQGPDFLKRIYGFWDGGNNYIVRVVATKPGRWLWTSGSNQPDDERLNDRSEKFNVISWTEEEKNQNPNRQGFIRETPNGHALPYTDGYVRRGRLILILMNRMPARFNT